MRADVGSGFQTIMFTGLEASTPLTQRLGDEGAQELLRGHNATVRTALDDHGGREVKHTDAAGRAEWVWRQLTQATPWRTRPRFLIRDRDRSYGGDFVARARQIGINTVLTPIATPQANAIAERLVGTLRRECLDHVIVVNERHLRHVLREFVLHYNEARPHQTLELRVPDERSRASPVASGRVVSRSVLGGLTHEYEREARDRRRVAGRRAAGARAGRRHRRASGGAR